MLCLGRYKHHKQGLYLNASTHHPLSTFISGRLICNGIFINTFGLLLWIIYRRSSMDFIREILIECIICQIQPQAAYSLDFFVILTILFQYRMCICIWYNLYKHINLMICWNLGLWSRIYRYRINIYLLYSVCVYGNIPCNMTYTRLSL